jgi:alpha-methylacyl-CoA racemase
MTRRRGPLAGIKVVELAGIGPGPLAGMLLADWGAEVVAVDRPRPSQIRTLIPPEFVLTNRGKRLTVADLKTEAGRRDTWALIERADVLLEGFRPGTLERLGFGPREAHERNPRLVYTRITGWGQHGPRSKTAGHDIDYIALTGALAAIGRAGEAPLPPLNLLGDYAGGTMFAVAGTLAALVEVARSGRGQVVDAAMIDGVGALLTPMAGMMNAGLWSNERGRNLLDTGSPFYDVYRTRDDRFVAVGALEDEFFAALIKGLGIDPNSVTDRWNPATWPALRERLASVFKEKTRDEWDKLFSDTDACVAPVLTLDETAADPHHRARNAFALADGHPQPAPAPRFGRTPAEGPVTPPVKPEPIERVIGDWVREEV